MAPLKVFVSATSRDLRSYRQVVSGRGGKGSKECRTGFPARPVREDVVIETLQFRP